MLCGGFHERPQQKRKVRPAFDVWDRPALGRPEAAVVPVSSSSTAGAAEREA